MLTECALSEKRLDKQLKREARRHPKGYVRPYFRAKVKREAPSAAPVITRLYPQAKKNVGFVAKVMNFFRRKAI